MSGLLLLLQIRAPNRLFSLAHHSTEKLLKNIKTRIILMLNYIPLIILILLISHNININNKIKIIYCIWHSPWT